MLTSYVTSGEQTFMQADTGFEIPGSTFSGIQANDIMLVSFVFWGLDEITSVPSGWELYAQATSEHTPPMDQRVYWKRATSSSEPDAEWTWTKTGAACCIDVVALVYRGVHRNGSPFDCTYSNVDASSGTSLVLPQITTTTAKCRIVGIVHHNTSGSSSCANFDNERIDSGNDNACYDEEQASAGATGSYTVTIPDGGGVGVLLALRAYTETITTVVDPDSGSGYDYDSLSDWESDLGNTTSGDLPAYNEIAVAKCRCTGGTADDGSLVTIESFTTDPSHYLKVWTDPAEGYRHNGTYQTGNKYRLEATTIADWHWGVRASAQNIVFDGIQLKYTYSHTQVLALGLGSRGSVQNSIVWGVCSTASCICDGILLGDTSLGCGGYAINNIVYGFKDSNDSQGVGINNAVTWLSENTYMLNNTVVGCHVGISGAGCFVFNNLCSGCTDGFLDCEADDAHCDYNASSVSGDAPGTHSRNNQTFTFAGASDYHLAASDAGAKGYGLNLYNHSVWPFQTDIDGQDRGASWDIGADEYVRTVRLRFLLDAAGDPAAAQFQLEYRYKPNEGSWGNWAIVPESEP